MISPPTRRELAFVILLAVAVLYFFSGVTTSHSSFPLEAFDRDIVASHHTSAQTEPQQSRLSWGSSTVPETQVIAHAPGWSIFDKLYVLNGTVYIVSDKPDEVPDVSMIYSKGIEIKPGKEAEDSRLPGPSDIQVISSKEAKAMFGSAAMIIDGVTFLVNDPQQFITHYYHWSAELWFGLWRTYSSLDHGITPNGTTKLPPPRRLMFNRIDAAHWRDYASMNQWVTRASFPSLNIEFIDDWNDRIDMGLPFVFERVLVADRSASMISYNYQRFQRSAASAFSLPGNANWWQPIRNNVVMSVGLEPATGGGTMGKPVITYVSRQDWGRRMLIPEHHDKLVAELHKLRDEYGYEVNIVSMDKLTRAEQLQLAARTTIMMGVHGNGLTALLWMNPTPRSTVIEFFFPGGFAHDYEYTTRALGMKHYGFWGSEYFTSPDVPLPAYVEGFQGNSIPVDGEVVARICRERLSLAMEDDD
ncbi:hypothetical protein CYLTODRAFT_393975 [Cylindrobasidium torrendii FP15055 ss-10]|uniref:Glycosyltransferase 61 catalytic domain-containing protein n=1 Tax=Cylindrobasidium torrendii FP15055 ss-10 TaxID=1314674 RepID=A0A0D7BGY1_9AGAR|nr:hypothetical protein CYLTODRAFT_393975 [Cylindrobasidium torrendii FP15055 ss-10]